MALPSSASFGNVASPPVSSHATMARLLSSMKNSEAETGASAVQRRPEYKRRSEGSEDDGMESQPRLATRSVSQNSGLVGSSHSGMNNRNAGATFSSFIQPVSLFLNYSLLR